MLKTEIAGFEPVTNRLTADHSTTELYLIEGAYRRLIAAIITPFDFYLSMILKPCT